jgi:subtilisin family serine protease
LAADGDVAEIGRVSLMRSFLSVSVPAIGASTFWDAGYSGQGVSVAVLDSGIRSDHPAFSGLNVVPKVFLDNLKTSFPRYSSTISRRMRHRDRFVSIPVIPMAPRSIGTDTGLMWLELSRAGDRRSGPTFKVWPRASERYTR